MKRRAFLAAALTVPSWRIARAQQGRPRHVALLLTLQEGDEEGVPRVAIFRQGLREAGLMEGQNLTVEVQWLGGDSQRARTVVGDVVERTPDVIVVNGTSGLSLVRDATNSIPVVFVVVADPLGAGFIRSLSRPGGNITGFGTFEPEIGGKWVEALREVAPHIRRVGVLTDPGLSSGFARLLHAVQSLAPSLGLETIPLYGRNREEIASAIEGFAGHPDGGLILLPTPVNSRQREIVYSLAIKHRLPAIYPFAFLARNGGLLAYGFEPADLFRRAGPYVARILNGEKPGELPVQSPTKFELVVNLKAAQAIDLAVPHALIARADEVIE